MSQFSVQIDNQELLDRLSKGVDRVRVSRGLYDVLRNRRRTIERHIGRTQFNQLGPSPASGGRNKRITRDRSGSLRRSIRARVSGGRTLPTLRVGVFQGRAASYASVAEQGTRRFNPDSSISSITPKGSKYLTLPVSSAAEAAGSARNFGAPLTPIIFKRIKGKNRNVAGALFITSELNRERAQARLSGRPLNLRAVQAAYLLLTRADVRPGYFLVDGVADYLDVLVDAIADKYEETIL